MKHRRASLPSKLLSLDLLKPPALEKGRRYERILAHRIDCQRAISPPVQQKGEATTKGVYGTGLQDVNRGFYDFHSGPQVTEAPLFGNSMPWPFMRFRNLGSRFPITV